MQKIRGNQFFCDFALSLIILRKTKGVKMKAVVLKTFGETEPLRWQELPTPQPKPTEVQIQISYAGVNPVDWKICAGHLKKLLPHEFPLIPGWDASGKISAIGSQVEGFSKGDEVYAYCRKPVAKDGTYAEYICVDASHVARKPKSLTLAEAAGIPLVALTAWQSLFDTAHLNKGQTVLIHAGAGGVGGMAIQFAKYAGAKIYTTASSKNHSYVKKLGADVAIDYTKENFAEVVKKLEPDGVDLVLDCAGYTTLDNSYSLVKPKGWIISIVNHVNEEICKEQNIHGGFVFVRPDGSGLKTIGELFDSSQIQVPTIAEMPWQKYTEAWEQIQSGHTQGKIVLKITG